MCGIVGYIGRGQASGILLSGLRRLEYRGYDSAGLAVLEEGELQVRRRVGPVANLAGHLDEEPVGGGVGIAHTRWATHGRPLERNAHPHVDDSGAFALVHNGVIENHDSIRALLEREGIAFHSDTDTECLVQLIGFLYRRSGDVLESVREALRDVQGSFGIALVSTHLPETLITARRGSPIVIGVGDQEALVASDVNALLAHTNRVTYLEDNEIVCVRRDGVAASRIDAGLVEKEFHDVHVSLEELELDGYPNYMLKEICQQPASLRNTLRGRLDVQAGRCVLGGMQPIIERLPRPQHVLLFGCGTAWHAALVGGYLIEQLSGLPTHVEYASELRYRNPVIPDRTLAVVLSQSGETADSLAALQEVKLKGATAMGIVNVVGSSIARETHGGTYLRVGPEIGVASTKAFTAQVAVLTMLAIELGRRRHLAAERASALIAELAAIPGKVEQALETSPAMQDLAERMSHWDNWLYLGRGVNYPVALEGALKLKEISYAHAEGMPAAEVKHGPLAMIDPGMPVVVLATKDNTYDKVLSNIHEVRSREGYVVAVATEGDTSIRGLADEVVEVPRTDPLLSPLVATIPLQLLAYHAALARGHDVDKPRNLAKSVTVE